MSSFAKALRALADRLGLANCSVPFELVTRGFPDVDTGGTKTSRCENSEEDPATDFHSSALSKGLIEPERSEPLDAELNSQERCSVRLFFVMDTAHVDLQVGSHQLAVETK